MKKENIFYFLAILTILILRLGNFLAPTREIIIDETVIHHFWVGTLLLSSTFLLPKKYPKLRFFIFPVALGLIIDELVMIILGNGKLYGSLYSILGIILMCSFLFVVRKRLIEKF